MMSDREPMSEERLLKLLQVEAQSANGWFDSELAASQADNHDRYLAQPYGDEIEGRSSVVTHDVEDTVNWVMPRLMDLFLSDAEDLLAVEDNRSVNIQQEKDIAAYLHYIMFRKNDGSDILWDFLWDGLVLKNGFIRVDYEQPKASPPKQYDGLSIEQVHQFVGNPEYEIISHEIDHENQSISVEVVHTPRVGEIVVEALAPEQFGYESDAVSIKEAGYHHFRQEVYLADLMTMYPDKADDLRPDGISTVASAEDISNDERHQSRHEDVGQGRDHSRYDEEERQQVTLVTSYIKIDYDGDGIVELREVKWVGNTILENTVVDESSCVAWTPMRIPHRLTGRALADTIKDLQLIKTNLTRFYIDGLAQSLAPRTVVNETGMDPMQQDAFVDRDIGDTIFVNGDPNAIVAEFATPDTSQSAIAAIEHVNQSIEQASGVMRNAMGHALEGIHDTAEGISKLQSAANVRIAMIGRWAAEAVEQVFDRILKLVVMHHDQPTIVRVNGRAIEIDPSGWSEDMAVTVHVGTAGESREEKLQKLAVIASEQKEIIQAVGLNTPFLTPQHFAAVRHDMVKLAGFRDSQRYFGEIPEGWQPPEQEDPKAAEAKAKLEIEAAKGQQQIQLQQQKEQAAHQVAVAQFQMQRQIESAKIQGERERHHMKLQSDHQIAQMRIMAERQIAYERMRMEYAIKENDMRWQKRIEEQKVENQKEIGMEQAKVKARAVNGSGRTMSTNRPGGDLSK